MGNKTLKKVSSRISIYHNIIKIYYKLIKQQHQNMFYFLLFYFLLFIDSTAQVARYLASIISLSLTYTIKYKFPLDQSTVPIICVLLLCISSDKDFTFSNAYNA
eukprot:546623_1